MTGHRITGGGSGSRSAHPESADTNVENEESLVADFWSAARLFPSAHPGSFHFTQRTSNRKTRRASDCRHRATAMCSSAWLSEFTQRERSGNRATQRIEERGVRG